MNSETTINNGRTLAGVINDLKQELKEFIDTRLQMLMSEMKQKTTMLKMVVPMLIVAAALGWVGFLLLTIALVSAIAALIGWGWSFLAVGLLYVIVAGATGFMAWREFQAEGVAPNRTIKVLKQDQIWLQNEARTQL
jgi:ABC-type multidrug transport system permease subunit